MIPRPFRWLPEADFPADEWRLIERGHHDDLLGRLESLFGLSNGYLGIRGSYDEARPAHQRGTFVNGFHETWPIVYAEDAYGFARSGQTIINAPDATIMRLYVDDEPLVLVDDVDLVSSERILDMHNGLLERELVWRTPLGKHVRVRSRRLVSLSDRHLAAISWEVEVEDGEAPLVISSELFNHQDHLRIERYWYLNGINYSRTIEAWRENFMRNADALRAARMAPDSRVAEVGAILAAGFRRLLENGSNCLADRGQSERACEPGVANSPEKPKKGRA